MNVFKVRVKTLGESDFTLYSDLALKDLQGQLSTHKCVVIDDMLIMADSIIYIHYVGKKEVK